MREGISEIVGEGKGPKVSRMKVYRALRELLCSSCAALIAEGELFTRKTLPQFGLRLMPRCWECVPFEMESGSREKRGSRLIDQLLNSPNETQSGPAEGSPMLNEKAARRLGSALARGRRKR